MDQDHGVDRGGKKWDSYSGDVGRMVFFVGVCGVTSVGEWCLLGLQGGIPPLRPTRAHLEKNEDANDDQDWKPGDYEKGEHGV